MGLGAILALIGPPLFKLAEDVFQGHKLGANRMGWVQAAAQQYIEFLVSGGKLPDGTMIPPGSKFTDAEMKAGLESLFQSKKLAGDASLTGWALIQVNQMVPLSTLIK